MNEASARYAGEKMAAWVIFHGTQIKTNKIIGKRPAEINASH